MKISVKSADRVLDVFEAFRMSKKPLSLSDLAERIGAPASSCHGLVRTLARRGYLYEAGRRFIYPTRRLLDVARTIVEHDPVLERIEPALLRLRDATRETVIFGKRQDDAVVYLEVLEGLHTVRYTARPGEFKPLHSSAIGKALLGALTEEQLAQLLERLELPRITDDTITDPGALVAGIAAGRRQGYFTTRGENVADVMAISVTAVLNGEPYGIAIAGPLHRMIGEVDAYAAMLIETQATLCAEEEAQ
jgi:IclR family acetate operon transcriptional repressor